MSFTELEYNNFTPVLCLGYLALMQTDSQKICGKMAKQFETHRCYNFPKNLSFPANVAQWESSTFVNLILGARGNCSQYIYKYLVNVGGNTLLNRISQSKGCKFFAYNIFILV